MWRKIKNIKFVSRSKYARKSLFAHFYVIQNEEHGYNFEFSEFWIQHKKHLVYFNFVASCCTYISLYILGINLRLEYNKLEYKNNVFLPKFTSTDCDLI